MSRALPTAARENEHGIARRRLDRVRQVELIEVVTAEGEGTADDEVRLVARYYSKTGQLLAIGSAS